MLKTPSFFSKIAHGFGYGIEVVVLVFFLVILILPQLRLWEINSFVVLSGSMEPALPTGSLILTLKLPEYQIGDIITIQTQNTTVTHRVIDTLVVSREKIFITKGDANENVDDLEVSKKEIIGKVITVFPWLGYIRTMTKNLWGFVFLIIVPMLFVIFDESMYLYKTLRGQNKPKAKIVFIPKSPPQFPLLPLSPLTIQTPISTPTTTPLASTPDMTIPTYPAIINLKTNTYKPKPNFNL